MHARSKADTNELRRCPLCAPEACRGTWWQRCSQRGRWVRWAATLPRPCRAPAPRSPLARRCGALLRPATQCLRARGGGSRALPPRRSRRPRSHMCTPWAWKVGARQEGEREHASMPVAVRSARVVPCPLARPLTGLALLSRSRAQDLGTTRCTLCSGPCTGGASSTWTPNLRSNIGECTRATRSRTRIRTNTTDDRRMSIGPRRRRS